MLLATFPNMFKPSEFIGPVYQMSVDGATIVDFYFICRIHFAQFVSTDVGAQFDAALVFDGQPVIHERTDALTLDVIFPSSALLGNVGKSVRICNIDNKQQTTGYLKIVAGFNDY